MSEELEFHALGSLEVMSNGVELDLGSYKQRSLLALLLANVNQLVSVDRIVEALWGEDSVGKENSLFVYVSRLRSVLEPGRSGRGSSSVLLTKGPGYLLVADPENVDFLRFEHWLDEARLVSESDADAAVELVDGALAEWRGDAFADFAYESFARNDIDRLDELHLEAHELRFDANLRRGQTTELVTSLETFVRENPYRERPVGQLMVALYRSGRQAEALRSFERHRRVLAEELGVDPSPELRLLEEQILLHDKRLIPRTQEQRISLGDGQDQPNPYKGLHAFRASDQANFFGREPLVAELLRRLDKGDGLVALVGPSGSGKSSVAHAGLIPKVHKEALGLGWLVAEMVPGAHPFTELEVALLRTTLDAPDSLVDQLAQGDQAILRAGLRLLPDSDARLLIVIDQFEELFTLVDNRDEQRRFLDALLVAIDDPHGRVRVVLTLRADFYDRPLLHPRFGARLGAAVVNVTPLGHHELEEAAVRPAAIAGVRLEPTLLARVLADVVNQPGALPMFQYTLTELYERREGATMVESAYEEMGGLRGAITHRAEELYLDIGPEEQAAAQQLFLRLVTMSDDGTWSRRRVKASEITSLDVDVVVLKTVIDRFGSHRLLFFDRDRVSGSPTVEVGHEALLSEWTRLEDWIKHALHDLVQHGSFANSVHEWERAEHDSGYLITGSRLAEYERWATTSAIQLNTRELEFLGASLDQRSIEVAADKDRAAREQQLAGKAKRRLWGLAAAILVLAGVAGAILLAALADTQRVALIHTDNPLMLQGLQQAERSFDIEVISVIPPWTSAANQAIDLAESGADLIVIEERLGGQVADVINEYPDTTFVTVFDEIASVAPNHARYTFADQEAGYLAGVAAAHASETDTLGFIGAFEWVDTAASLAGFQQGAWSVNPEADIQFRWLTEEPNGEVWDDPELGYQGARDLFEHGADVVYHHAGNTGLGVFRAAREATAATGTKRWGVGASSDQYFSAHTDDVEFVLMSAIKRVDTVVLHATKNLLDGQLADQRYVLTMADDGIDYVDSGNKLSPTVVSALDDAMDSIVDGAVLVTPNPVIAISTNGLERNDSDNRFDLVAGGNRLTAIRVDGLRLGFLPDMIDESATRLGLQVVHMEGTFTQVLEAVEQGTADVGLCGCDITRERQENYLFTPPVFRNSMVLLVNNSSSFNSIDDLSSVTLGKNSSNEEFVRTEYPNIEVKATDGVGPSTHAEIVGRGQADGWVTSFGPQLETDERFSHLKILETLKEVFQAFPIHMNRPELADALNETMNDMLDDGTIFEAYERWEVPPHLRVDQPSG